MSNPLFDVREVLRSRQMASVMQIAGELRLPVSVVEDMLAHWVRRGMASRVEQTATGCGSGGCNTCGQCTGAPAKSGGLYAWDGPGAAQVVRHPTIALRAA